MSQKSIWLKYYVNSIFQRYWNTLMVITKVNKLSSAKFKKDHISGEAAAQYIMDSIENKRPTLISRFGCFESRCLGEGFGIEYGVLKKYSETALRPLYNNAGVFPYGQEGAERFFKITEEAIKEIDLLGTWTTEMQDYLVNIQCSKDMLITKLEHLEPYLLQVPWTKALARKKVVVVHPFKDTIESQYTTRREKLFSDPDVLPEFDLRVVKAVQTIAGQKDERFSDWGQALDHMYEQCMAEDFDVAIVGCGAYGMPLAAKLKRAGKVAIHLGGATQVLFGIKGGRWDNNLISQLYNDSWVRAAINETPINAKTVEKGCYW